MIDSSVDIDEISYELDMPDIFASFERLVFSIYPTGVFLRHQLARTTWIDLDLRAQQILSDHNLVDDDTVLAASIP
ncbi:unnamed protein product, partial [Rotaria sp. Silwood1]